MEHQTSIGTLTTSHPNAKIVMRNFVDYINAAAKGREEQFAKQLPALQAKLDAFNWDSITNDIQTGTGVYVSPKALATAILK